jgi:uncharacterized membrane protein
MKKALLFTASTALTGFLIIVPIYLAVLLLLKGMQSIGKLVQPIMSLLPDWFPGETLLSLLVVLLLCFLVGAAIRTQSGHLIQERVERKFLERIPGYAVIRSLTHQLAGESRERAWKPALAEIEEALVPAFIIEEFDDGRYTVFVPSVPTPFAGAIYILERKRVHPVDVPFTQALQVVARWGSGAKSLDMAMQKSESRVCSADANADMLSDVPRRQRSSV